MTTEEFKKRMLLINEDVDPETKHINADDLMCQVLTELGYGEGVEIFYDMDIWYS